MKSNYMKWSVSLLFAVAAVGCSGSNNNNPVPPNPMLNTASICNPATNPSYLSNPQCTNLNNNPGINTLQNLPNLQTSDIGVIQAGGAPVIRNRQFTLGRGYGIETTSDQCTVDAAGDHADRPVKRALHPGMDYMTFSFDQAGNLMIDFRTGVGEVRTPGPIVPCGTTTGNAPANSPATVALQQQGVQASCYQLTSSGTEVDVAFPAGFVLLGQPSAAYVGMETRLGFGMLKKTDEKIRDDNDIPLDNSSNPWAPLPGWAPSYSAGGTGTNLGFNLSGPNPVPGQQINGQLNGQAINGGVQPIGGLGLTGNGVNELSMQFNPVSATVVTYPINPQHVMKLSFQGLTYQGSSNVAIQTPAGSNTCPATSTGELLYTDFQ